MKKKISYFQKYLFLLGKDKSKLLYLLVFTVVSSSIELLTLALIGPYFFLLIDPTNAIVLKIKNYISLFGYDFSNNKLIVFYSFLIIIVFFLKFIFTVSTYTLIKLFCNKKLLEIRKNLILSFLNMPYSNFLKKNNSEYIYNSHSLVEIWVSKVLNGSLIIASELIVALAIITYLGFQDIVMLSTLVLIITLVIITYDFFLSKKSALYGKKSAYHGILITNSIQESMYGFKEVRIFKKEKYFSNLVNEHTAQHNNFQFKSYLIGLLPRYLFEFIIISFMAIVIMINSYGSNIINSIGVLIVFGVAALRILPVVSKISASINELRNGEASTNIIYDEIINNNNEITILEKPKQGIEFQSIKFSNISFNYEGKQEMVLDEISLNIDIGDRVGIIGESGSGKSTLVNILLGFLKPSNGLIYLNDEEIQSKNTLNLQNLVAYIPQETFIISGSILDNIAFGENIKNIDHDKVNECIKKSNLKPFIDKLQDGVNTSVGDRGITVSGGQRQRIVLARAFYLDRKILVLDEATSSLDQNTEEKIIDEIKSLSTDITLIIISHNIKSLEGCNKIFSLNKGKLTKEGNYLEYISVEKNDSE